MKMSYSFSAYTYFLFFFYTYINENFKLNKVSNIWEYNYSSKQKGLRFFTRGKYTCLSDIKMYLNKGGPNL